MTDAGLSAGRVRALQILATWLSPAYPVGAYSYSHGLEWAIETGRVRNGTELAEWTAQIVAFGAGRSDTILLSHAWRSEDPSALAELAEALAPSSERHLETTAQGRAFSKTTAAAWNIPLLPLPYPIAVGQAARHLALPLDLLAPLFLQAFAANVISAGVRLIPIGQTEGQTIMAGLLPLAAEVARQAQIASLEELGGIAIHTDLASMLHETQYTRLYRS